MELSEFQHLLVLHIQYSINHFLFCELCRSSEARPVPFSNYLKLLEYLVNKVNVIRGPVPYMVRIYPSPFVLEP